MNRKHPIHCKVSAHSTCSWWIVHTNHCSRRTVSSSMWLHAKHLDTSSSNRQKQKKHIAMKKKTQTSGKSWKNTSKIPQPTRIKLKSTAIVVPTPRSVMENRRATHTPVSCIFNSRFKNMKHVLLYLSLMMENCSAFNKLWHPLTN